MLSDYFLYTKSKLSPPNMPGEVASSEKVYTEVSFDHEILESKNLMYLKRGSREDYDTYFKRIDKFLGDQTIDKLNELLMIIDPNIAKFKPTTEYLSKKIESKKSSCVLI